MSELQALTAKIVMAYVSANHVQQNHLPSLIRIVAHELDDLTGRVPVMDANGRRLSHAQIESAVTPDRILCFEDGRWYRSLLRPLRARGLSPDGYREKWGLDPSYPMVAENFSKRRSEIAKNVGLGHVVGRVQRDSH